jgi:rare lipoprotein A
MLSNIRSMLAAFAVIAVGAGGASAQTAVSSIPPEDMPAGNGPRGTSGTVSFDDAGRAAIDPAIPAIAAAVNGVASGYAEVTSLDNGKTILVLVAPTGAAPGRLATLSPAAANMLGISADGALVRVRSVEPPPQDRGALRAGKPAAPRLDTPLALLTPLRHRVEARSFYAPPAAPAPTPRRNASPPPKREVAPPASRAGASYTVPGASSPAPQPASVQKQPPSWAPSHAPADSGYFVQVAALSSEARARDLAHSLGGQVQPVGAVWRVRLGPYRDAEAAQHARDGAVKRGYAGAQIVHQ